MIYYAAVFLFILLKNSTIHAMMMELNYYIPLLFWHKLLINKLDRFPILLSYLHFSVPYYFYRVEKINNLIYFVSFV